VSSEEVRLHVRGASRFLDDQPLPAGTLHAAVVASAHAHGRLLGIDAAAASSLPGVRAILTAADVPGENQIGTLVPDEPLLAEGIIHFVGQPAALVVADTPAEARRAARAVRVTVEPLPAVLDARQAGALGALIAPPRTFALGDVDAAWPRCARIAAGRAETGGQEHLYLETQSAWAAPTEEGGVRVASATQAPTGVQRGVARVLGLAMHRVEVDVRRLGGAFGGKEDQATHWAALAALGARHLGRPVKLVLSRREDMRWTGKRHPYASDFRIGIDAEGRILAYEVTYYQNAGAAADLSMAILERTLFHATGSYFVPHVRARAYSCRTNLPPNTACRGFGAPQAAFVIEAAIRAIAEAVGRPAEEIQRLNLLREGDEFPYGMRARGARAERCWDEACVLFRVEERRRAIAAANAAADPAAPAMAAANAAADPGAPAIAGANGAGPALAAPLAATPAPRYRRGLAMMPICFGISFTNTSMNQASALVHVYSDGSVGVSTGAVEMGQGVHAKLRQVAARTLGVGVERVKVESTNTMRNANTSPTAASTGADLNGQATRLACLEIAGRLRGAAAARAGCSSDDVGFDGGRVLVSGRPIDLDWETLVREAHRARVNLSAHAHYATPGIGFDRSREKGEPFAYHVYGAAVVEATVDALLGTYTIDAVRAVHDGGRLLDPLADLGQAEGGIVQGLGWMTIEDVRHDAAGALETDTLTTYKVPDLDFAPREIEVRFLEDADHPGGLFASKAIGEPPLLYGIGGFFALREALRAARPGGVPPFTAPLTPERALLWLAGQDEAGA